MAANSAGHCPVILPSLNIADMQGNDLRSTQATTHRKSEMMAASRFSRKRFRSGSREERFTLCDA
jgi:hypothetical protein